VRGRLESTLVSLRRGAKARAAAGSASGVGGADAPRAVGAAISALAVIAPTAALALLATLVTLAAAQPAAPAAEPFDEQLAISGLQERIAGHENDPSETVFQSIQVMKGVPAERLLRIMETGFGRSLGVNCTHCHVAGKWESEEKSTKQITRQMMQMVQTINAIELPKIKGLKSDKPAVNCTTCHRGEVKPALDLADKTSQK
jgi:hypothetical protein